MSSRLVIKAISKKFKQRQVVRDVSFDVRKGQTVGIVGRNGSGKSTILAAMEYLVTGVIPLEGTKDLNISQYAQAEDPSEVSGVIRHDGHVMTITRRLRGGNEFPACQVR